MGTMNEKISWILILILIFSLIGSTIYFNTLAPKEQEIQNLEEELISKEKDLIKAENNNDQLQSQIQTINSTLNSLEDNYNELESNYEDLETNHTDLQADYKDLKQKKRDLREDLEQKLARTEKELMKAENNNDQLQSQVETINSTLNILEDHYNELETEYNNLENSYEDLETNYNNLKSEHKELETNHTDLQEDYNDLQQEREELQEDIDDLQDGYTLYKPTNSEVKEFLKNNKVDQNQYPENEYKHLDYTADLINNATEKGYKAAVVELYLERSKSKYYDEYLAPPLYLSNKTSYTLTAFKTSDNGTIFVEPQTDTIMKNLKEGDYYWQEENEARDKEWEQPYKYKITKLKII